MRRKGTYTFWAVLIACAALRLWQSFSWKAPDLTPCLGHVVEGSGIIVSEPERKDSGQVFAVYIDDLCGNEAYLRMKTKPYPSLLYGQQIKFSGKISIPYNFSGGNGRTFDFKGYLAKDRIYYEMKSAVVSAIPDGVLPDDVQASPVAAFLYGLKRSFVSNLERALGEPQAGLAAGLVMGEKAALGADLLDKFRLVGLIHIVVLSGYNITIVGDAMRKVLSFLPRVWGIVMGAAGIVLFGILVGAGATVTRSCIMALIALSADLIRRDYSVARALVLAGLVMIVENPLIFLHDPSFQLSFLATTGLIILSEPIESRLFFLTERFGLRGIVASTLATQIFVTPYILHMMGQVSVIGIVANILVLPLIPTTMLFVFLTGAAGFAAGPFPILFGYAAHALLSYELFMVNTFSRLSFAAIEIPPLSGWWIAGYYAIFAFFSMFSQLRLAKKSSI